MSQICRLPWIAALFTPGSMQIGLRGSQRERCPWGGTRSQSRCWSGTGRTRTTTRQVASSRRTSRCVFGSRAQRSFSYRSRGIHGASFRFSQAPAQGREGADRSSSLLTGRGDAEDVQSPGGSGSRPAAEGEDATRQRRDGHPGREQRPVTSVDRDNGRARRVSLDGARCARCVAELGDEVAYSRALARRQRTP